MGNIISRLRPEWRRPSLLRRRRGFRHLRGYRRREDSQHPQDLEQSQASQEASQELCPNTPEQSHSPALWPSFRFLALPTELRLSVYEELISHHSQDIVLRNPGELDLILTSVTQSPVLPILLTCKRIFYEAAPILQQTLLRKSAGYPAPRVILRTRRMPYPNMPDDTQVVNLCLLEDFCHNRRATLVDEKCSDVCEAFFNQTNRSKVGPTALTVANSTVETMRKAERYFLRLNGPDDTSFGGSGPGMNRSWMEEAADIIYMQHANISRHLDQDTLQQDIRKLAKRLAVAPGALATGISLCVMDRPKRNAISDILEDHYIFMRHLRVRVFVYTSWETGNPHGLFGEWICFQGKMSEEMWVDEWT